MRPAEYPPARLITDKKYLGRVGRRIGLCLSFNLFVVVVMRVNILLMRVNILLVVHWEQMGLIDAACLGKI